MTWKPKHKSRNKRRPEFVDMTGKVIGRLTVVYEILSPSGFWFCLCECGGNVTRYGCDLRGAEKREIASTCGNCAKPVKDRACYSDASRLGGMLRANNAERWPEPKDLDTVAGFRVAEVLEAFWRSV